LWLYNQQYGDDATRWKAPPTTENCGVAGSIPALGTIIYGFAKP
jgi:hypothetical protein